MVGDLTSVQGSYETPQGLVRSAWTRTDRWFKLTVGVPANTAAEVWVPLRGGRVVGQPHRATLLRVDGDHAVYRVPSGTFVFVTATR